MSIKLSAFGAILFIISFTFFYSCTKEGVSANNNAGTGKGGSLTRFTIAGDYLYAVDNHYLYAYSLTNPMKPAKVYTSPLNFDIETIYPFDKYLFLGTRTGLLIYSIDTASAPRLIGQASHARSCDPVVANDSVAFVTLKGNGNCGPAVSGLYVYDIKTIGTPMLQETVELHEPVGLGLQDSVLYVCCGDAGLKVFNVKSPYSPKLITTKKDALYVDVIPYNGILICFARAGILLYDIANPAIPILVKEIAN
ncbi:MAG: hypothetical protein V4717_03910 [Bacteroidota bacterium]